MSANPLAELLGKVAGGRPIPPEALDQLPLPDAAAAELVRTADLIRALRRTGLYTEAHRLAAVAGADLRRHLDTAQAQP